MVEGPYRELVERTAGEDALREAEAELKRAGAEPFEDSPQCPYCGRKIISLGPVCFGKWRWWRP